MNEEKNIQLQPVNKMLVPIDKISPGLFGLTDLKLKKVEGKKNQYTFSDSGVNVPIYLEPPSGEKLETSDFAIFCAAISEYSAGNPVFTIRRLWRKIGGSHTLTTEMKKFISDSVEKLQYTKFSADLSKINEKFKCEGEKFFKSYLLPIKSIETRVNGKTSAGNRRVHFVNIVNNIGKAFDFVCIKIGFVPNGKFAAVGYNQMSFDGLNFFQSL